MHEAQGALTTVVNFDTPEPPGSADSILSGVFSGLDFGSGSFRWSGAYGANNTNHIYFSSNVSSGTFSFAGASRVLQSVRVHAFSPVTLTLSDNSGQSRSLTLNAGTSQVLTTGWINPSTTVTVSSNAGWQFGLDDITSNDGNTTPDTTPPTVALTTPAAGATISGSVALSATASDAIGVVGVQFLVDGVAVGTEDVAAPYAISWNSAASPNGPRTIAARARDAAGNSTTSTARIVTVENSPGTIVNFDAPAPPGASDSVLSGLYNGIDFGSNQWRWTGPYAANSTNHAYFSSDAPSRAFSFSGGSRLLRSVRLYVGRSGTITLSDNNGQSRAAPLTPGVVALVATNWTQPSSTVTVTSNVGWDFGIDDIDSLAGSGNGDTSAPTVAITAPATNGTVSATTTIGANAADNVGVVGVRFRVDGVDVAPEDTIAPYSVAWNTTTTANGSRALTAVARDAAGNTTTSVARIVNVQNAAPSGAGSLNFHVNGSQANDYATLSSLPSTFGAGEFTLELWVRPDASLPVGPAFGASFVNWSSSDPTPYSSSDWWYAGNFLLDGHGNNGGESGSFNLQFYGGGRVRWLFHDGTQLYGVQARPASSAPSLLDGQWHRIAVIRRFIGSSQAQLELWVDGVQRGVETSPARTNMRTWWDSWSSFPANQRGWFFGAEKIAAVGGGYWDDYKGLLSEMRFWSRARTSVEVSSSSQALVGNEAGLVGRFRFGEGSGNSTCDSLAPSRCITLIPRENPIWATATPTIP